MLKIGKIWRKSIKRSVEAVSPVISTVILTAVIVSLIFATIVFANDFLTTRLAETEFNAMKQFMQNVALQVDDVAWVIGRTQTIRYSSRYGRVNFIEAALSYVIYLKMNESYYECIGTYIVGSLIFNMPIDKYSIGNDHFEMVYPSSERSFVINGTSAPVARVFVSEKLPMADGNYIRVSLIPCIRLLRSSITEDGETTNYYRLYLPILKGGSSPRKSQTVTLTSQFVSTRTFSDVLGINVTVSFPSSPEGFDIGFFGFESSSVSIDFPENSILEVYISNVTVSLGVHV